MLAPQQGNQGWFHEEYSCGTPSIIRDHYKQLYANKMDNLEETCRFLERYNLSRLNKEEIEKVIDDHNY